MKIIVCGNSVTFKSDLTIAEIEKKRQPIDPNLSC